MKKTGATPIVAIEDLRGGRVQGVSPVTTILVKYTDGHGKKEVRLAAVIPGGEIYFFTNNAIDTRPAQQWLKSAILDHLKTQLTKQGVGTTSMIEVSEDRTTQV